MKRIVKLNEQDLYTIVRKVISEQQNKTTQKPKTFTPDKTLTFEIKGNWKSGYHSWNNLSPEGKTDFMNKVKEISTFIKENAGSDVSLTVEVGESLLKNKDNEQGGKDLKTGELAELRGKTISNQLTLALEKVISPVPNIEIKHIQGKIPVDTEKYKEACGKDKNSQECRNYIDSFIPDQFVRIILNAKKEGECIANLFISISYLESKASKRHRCNEALFRVFINGVFLGIANLNNVGDNPPSYVSDDGKKRTGPKENVTITNPGVKPIRDNGASGGEFDRRCYWNLTSEFASMVFSKNSKEITIQIEGMNYKEYGTKGYEHLHGVHAEVPYVVISRYDATQGKFILVYGGEPNVTLKRGSDQRTTLLTLDGCATKVIKFGE